MDTIEKVLNKKQLIDANALDERFDKRIKWLRLDVHDQYSLGLYHGAITDKDLIGEMPTVDAMPVVHGKWVQVIVHVETDDGFVDRVEECCSACHKPNGRRCTYFCPNCGAKMDGELNE